MAMWLAMLVLMVTAAPVRAEPTVDFAAGGWPILASITELAIATDDRVVGPCWTGEEATRTAVGEALSTSGFRLIERPASGADREAQAFLTLGAFGHQTEEGSCIVVLELGVEYLLAYRVPGAPDRLARSDLLVWHDSSVLSGPAEGLSPVIMGEALMLAQNFVTAVEAARRLALVEWPG